MGCHDTGGSNHISLYPSAPTRPPVHHAKFECNYGFSFPNYLDKAFGTYEDGSKYLKASGSNGASKASAKRAD